MEMRSCSSIARTLELWVRILLEEWIHVHVFSVVLSFVSRDIVMGPFSVQGDLPKYLKRILSFNYLKINLRVPVFEHMLQFQMICVHVHQPDGRKKTCCHLLEILANLV